MKRRIDKKIMAVYIGGIAVSTLLCFTSIKFIGVIYGAYFITNLILDIKRGYIYK